MVTVPCSACGGKVRFGDEVCRTCSAKVSAELEEALGARLEATNDEYRKMQKRLWEARILLLVLGLLNLTIATFARFAVSMDAVDQNVVAAENLAYTVACGSSAGMLFGAWWARRSPKAGLVMGLLAWLLPQALLVLVAPWTLATGVLLKLLTILVLLRGFAAIKEAKQLRAQLIAKQAEESAV
jgi:hypothetical protein